MLIKTILVMVIIAVPVPAQAPLRLETPRCSQALPSFERPRETEVLLTLRVLRLEAKRRLIVGNSSLIFTQSDKQIGEFLVRQGSQGLIWLHRKAVLEVGS